MGGIPLEERAFLHIVRYQFEPESNVDFVIHLKDLSRSEVVKRKACQIFAECGIDSPVSFTMTKYKIDVKEKPSIIDEFVCRGGEIVENRTLPPKHDGKEEK